MRTRNRRAACDRVSLLAAAALAAAAQAQPPDTRTTGDAARGAMLYTDGYKCYACHGYDAQTGERRLKPMRFTEAAFVTLVRNSPLPQMPTYADVPAEDLADVYAYILSIPVDAPPLGDVPLLEDILGRKLETFAD